MSLVQYDVADEIAWLRIDRPDAHNALNEAVVSQLHAAARQAIDDSRIRGLVIAAEGKAFVAGADLKFFVRCLIANDVDRIIRFTQVGHALLNMLAESSKPVVARVHGIAFGGGLELALACRYIVATPAARFAFPETGLGVYPGLGGTQRTPRRLGVGLAKWLIYTGHTLTADEALQVGLVSCVATAPSIDRQLHDLIDGAPVRPRSPLSPAHQSLDEFCMSQSLAGLLNSAPDTFGDAPGARAIRQLSSKAPLALRLSEQLIDRGIQLPLSAGLQLELDHLREIFSTEDARTGLGTLGLKRPSFVGR